MVYPLWFCFLKMRDSCSLVSKSPKLPISKSPNLEKGVSEAFLALGLPSLALLFGNARFLFTCFQIFQSPNLEKGVSDAFLALGLPSLCLIFGNVAHLETLIAKSRERCFGGLPCAWFALFGSCCLTTSDNIWRFKSPNREKYF